METRRASAEIAYPFVRVSSGAMLTYAQGVKDIFIVASGYPVDPQPPTDIATYGQAWGRLVSVTVGLVNNIYVFYAVCEKGTWVYTFTVPRGQGIVRVACDEIYRDAHMIVDSSRLYTVPGVHVLPATLEVEPAQICWQVTEIKSITLVNECRHHDPSQRVNMPPDRIRLVLEADRPGINILKLRDGWNCALTYDETTGILRIEGGPGLGRGLPETIYWDSDPPDFDTGVLSINGLSDSGGNPTVNNVNIRPGESVTLTQKAADATPPRLTFTVKEETDA